MGSPVAPPNSLHLALPSEAQTKRLGTHIGKSLRGGEVLALFGDLGTGKTTLIRAIAQGMGIHQGEVTSPTFIFLQEHPGLPPLVHADLYRLESSRDIEHLGLSEYFDGRWVVAIEWAERITESLPDDRLEIHLAHHSPSSRHLVLQGRGRQGDALVKAIARRLQRNVATRSKSASPHK